MPRCLATSEELAKLSQTTNLNHSLDATLWTAQIDEDLKTWGS